MRRKKEPLFHIIYHGETKYLCGRSISWGKDNGWLVTLDEIQAIQQQIKTSIIRHQNNGEVCKTCFKIIMDG